MAVIKRDGKRQSFNASKLRKSIEKAAKEAGMSAGKRKELIKEISEPVIKLYKNRSVKAVALRRSILGRLDRKAKSVSKAWRRHDRKKRKL